MQMLESGHYLHERITPWNDKPRCLRQIVGIATIIGLLRRKNDKTGWDVYVPQPIGNTA